MPKRRYAEISQAEPMVLSDYSGNQKVGSKWRRNQAGKKAAKLSQPMKVAIRRELRREVEVKSKQTYYGANGLYGPAAATFNSVNNVVVCPSSTVCDINQGTGEGARIGNQIRTRKLVYRGILCAKPYSGSTNPTPKPVEVRMVFYRQRNDPAVLPPSPSTDFFQFNNTTNPIPDSLQNQIQVVNTDKYQVFMQRVYKVGWALNATTDAPSSSVPVNAQPNNDFSINCKFAIDLTKYLPKVIRYNDNNAEPTSAGLFCLFILAYADGTAIGNAAIPVELSSTLDFQYEDM